ncbi:MAG: CZB domain-containing protein [Gallionella sp.]|nr:CZB domain-containing protein [Gallionella sp.]MDD4959158.1 CZB domain-containing protein [Gallionella sp.]
MLFISWSNFVIFVLATSAIVYVFNKVRINNQKKRISFAELQYAIDAHTQWKSSFQRYLTSAIHGRSTLSGSMTNSESFDCQVIRQDNQCALGKWLYQNEKLHDSPEFVELLETHRSFHQQASQILQLSLEGKHKEVMQCFNHNSDFQKNSANLSRQLVQLYEDR